MQNTEKEIMNRKNLLRNFGRHFKRYIYNSYRINPWWNYLRNSCGKSTRFIHVHLKFATFSLSRGIARNVWLICTNISIFLDSTCLPNNNPDKYANSTRNHKLPAKIYIQHYAEKISFDSSALLACNKRSCSKRENIACSKTFFYSHQVFSKLCGLYFWIDTTSNKVRFFLFMRSFLVFFYHKNNLNCYKIFF